MPIYRHPDTGEIISYEEWKNLYESIFEDFDDWDDFQDFDNFDELEVYG